MHSEHGVGKLGTASERWWPKDIYGPSLRELAHEW
jgi:hypothetical protein